MSKRTTTRWYIGAWVVAVLALVVAAVAGHGAQANGPAPTLTLCGLVFLLCGLVMFVAWVGALMRLGSEHAWGWFVGVLVLHLIGLGIIGMAAYAAAGPDDGGVIAMRPSMT